MDYSYLILKTGSLDNAIREFWLAKPSWVMSHYTMIWKHGKHMRDFLGLDFLRIIPWARVGYEMIDSQRGA